mmetsp:Transcript_31462/g.57119  ORF Transcript_31462/g.57119 Transcript_31462/m.57119 type:complete len:297 (-) Transcript_31462:275-1165(-)
MANFTASHGKTTFTTPVKRVALTICQSTLVLFVALGICGITIFAILVTVNFVIMMFADSPPVVIHDFNCLVACGRSAWPFFSHFTTSVRFVAGGTTMLNHTSTVRDELPATLGMRETCTCLTGCMANVVMALMMTFSIAGLAAKRTGSSVMISMLPEICVPFPIGSRLSFRAPSQRRPKQTRSCLASSKHFLLPGCPVRFRYRWEVPLPQKELHSDQADQALKTHSSGQAVGAQDCTSRAGPSHSTPPLAETKVLRRSVMPPPHVFVQGFQAPHSFQTQSLPGCSSLKGEASSSSC